jgi:hypothetical protein
MCPQILKSFKIFTLKKMAGTFKSQKQLKAIKFAALPMS